MKKRFLELLIIQAGLKPRDVRPYRTNGCDGQYEIAYGWMGEGIDKKGNIIVSFQTPEGFNDAVAEIMKQIYETEGINIQPSQNFKL